MLILNDDDDVIDIQLKIIIDNIIIKLHIKKK